MSAPVLVLIAGDTPEAPLGWVRLQSGLVVAKGAEIRGEATSSLSGDCILVLPGFEAQLRILETPTRSGLQAKAAAAHQFRSALAVPTADTLFAVAEPAGASGARLVAAIARPRLSAWLARCAESRLVPRAVYLDCAIWPVEPGSAHMVRLGDRTLVAAGALGGFTIESALAPALLGPWLAQTGPAISTLHLTGWTPDQIIVQPGIRMPALVSGSDIDPFHALARAAVAMPPGAPDLAQETTGAGKGARSSLTSWILAGSLAAGVGLTQIGITILDGLRDADAARSVMASTEAAFRAARPETKRISNLRAQVTAAINGAQHVVTNPVLLVSPSVADMLVSHPDVQLDEIRHDASNPAVSLRFSSLTSAELDAAVAKLQQRSGRIDIGPMQAIDGRASVTVSMRAS